MDNLYSKIPSGFLQTKFTNFEKMEAKKILVSFLTIATLLLLVSTISASELTNLTNEYSVKVDGEYVMVDGVLVGSPVAINTEDTISVKVVFTSDVDASNVKIKAEIDGQKLDIEDITAPFDVEQGKRYSKTLNLKIPYELKDDLSDDYELELEISNKDYETEIEGITLRVQRESYNVEVMSINTVQTVKAGRLLPVDLVLKNIGYNKLDDMYVTLSIPTLGTERTGYFGDIVELEELYDGDDDKDTVSGRIYLQIPEDAKSGVYTIEAEASNDDTTETASEEIRVENPFSGNNVIATVTGKSVAVNENAVYSVLIVNPTSTLKVYRIVPETSADLSVSVDESVVAVPAGSSKTVSVTANAASEGAYTFNVDVLSDEKLVDSVILTASVEGRTMTGNPIVVLTVILAIIFIVLLIVLVVLLGKKPEKSEEFSESYY